MLVTMCATATPSVIRIKRMMSLWYSVGRFQIPRPVGIDGVGEPRGVALPYAKPQQRVHKPLHAVRRRSSFCLESGDQKDKKHRWKNQQVENLTQAHGRLLRN